MKFIFPRTRVESALLQILEVQIHSKNISKTDTLLIQQLKVPMKSLNWIWNWADLRPIDLKNYAVVVFGLEFFFFYFLFISLLPYCARQPQELEKLFEHTIPH